MNLWTHLADLVVAVHLAWVLYVVLGQVAVLYGAWRRKRWSRNPWFRWSHLTCTLVVAVEGALGWTCPLTTWERDLRERGGQVDVEEISFVGRLLRGVLFYDVPQSTLNVAYVAFGLFVAATLVLWPPRTRDGAGGEEPQASE